MSTHIQDKEKELLKGDSGAQSGSAFFSGTTRKGKPQGSSGSDSRGGAREQATGSGTACNYCHKEGHWKGECVTFLEQDPKGFVQYNKQRLERKQGLERMQGQPRRLPSM